MLAQSTSCGSWFLRERSATVTHRLEIYDFSQQDYVFEDMIPKEGMSPSRSALSPFAFEIWTFHVGSRAIQLYFRSYATLLDCLGLKMRLYARKGRSDTR